MILHNLNIKIPKFIYEILTHSFGKIGIYVPVGVLRISFSEGVTIFKDYKWTHGHTKPEIFYEKFKLI